MKKWIISILILMLIVTILSSNSFAFTKTKYFGVGSTVDEIDQATYLVRTKGEKDEEGFVFTPNSIKQGERVTFSVSLQGEGTVFFKIVETDARGKFIKEHISPMILLTSEWKEYKILTALNKNTDQVDVLVITGGKQQTEFLFRDALVK